ncbi:Dna2/Cas4 domain-containing protein, partial [Acinetobacter baumannii]
FKRGRPKAHRADDVQLCAQALCLEEMTGRAVPEGALCSGETRRRLVGPVAAERRRLTEDAAAAMRRLIADRHTPPAVYQAGKCR